MLSYGAVVNCQFADVPDCHLWPAMQIRAPALIGQMPQLRPNAQAAVRIRLALKSPPSRIYLHTYSIAVSFIRIELHLDQGHG